MNDLVMSWFEDKESQFIFKNRVAYNESGNERFMREIIDCYVPELKGSWYPEKERQLIKKAKDSTNIWIWGGGLRGRYLIKKLWENDIKVCGIVDIDSEVAEVLGGGIPVFSPDKVDFGSMDCLIVSMRDKETAENCAKQAAVSGMAKENIVLFRECGLISLDKEYFEEFIEYKEGETFVDAGVLNLATSYRFAEECDKHGIIDYKIYAFEPDKQSYQNCLKIKEKHLEKRINLYNLGLWSSNMSLGFSHQELGASHVTDNEDFDKIDVVSLDGFIKDKITFIKMDIEGAELEALKGCSDIIKQYKPKLAICVYHKKEDIIEIPRYIKELVPEYKLYLRHYSNYETDTVLYALP